MSRFGAWLTRGRSTASQERLNLTVEAQNMDIALRAAEKIMNDDIKGAEEGLKTGDSAFHKLAKGTLGFMKATLGFEQDVMREASDLLYEAETSAYAYYQQAQKDQSAYQSQIYDKGTEFLLCQAEAQIMSAIVGVLNESVTESLKGFYKMRKAYMILEQIMQMEYNYAKMNNVQSLDGSRVASRTTSRSSLKSTQSSNMGTPALPTVVEPPQPRSHLAQPSSLRNATTADSDDDDEFYDAAETEKERLRNGGPSMHIETPETDSDMEKSMQHLSVGPPSRPTLGSRTSTATSRHGLIDLDAKSEVFQNGPDVFIHSGTNLMFGIISLMLGVVPPTFSKILSIVGFRGDREKGMLMLWQASKFRNINGGMAALMLFGWYNGMINFCDIYSDPDPELDPLDQYEGYPIQRLEALLEEMRGRYPDSQLWQIEEARMAAARRNTDRALQLLSNSVTSDMKQLQALKMFEQSLNAQFSHKYELTAQSYLQCVELNGWSQALYYYVTGAAYLHMSRDSRMNGATADVTKYEKLAEEYFRKAPTLVGKKKMMGRQLPFDSLVQRKINKWEANAKAWDCSLIDAVGVAPIEEMIYLWNGYKKMSEPYLRKSLQNLEYTEQSAHFSKFGTDEKALLALLRASVYRNLREHKRAQAILEQNVFCHPKAAFAGQYMDTWAAPSSYYEHAVNSWQQRSEYVQRFGRTIAGPSGDTGYVTPTDRQGDAVLVADAKKHVEVAKAWGAYELDARIGMKMTAALGAIGKWERRNGIL